MHHVDADKTHSKLRQSYLEQVLDAALDETTAVRTLTSHLDVPLLAEQQELIYISSVRTPVDVLKTCRKRWLIGTDGKRVREIRAAS